MAVLDYLIPGYKGYRQRDEARQSDKMFREYLSKELAAESVRFDAARAPSPWTLPSMTSIMTGVSPLVHRAVRRNSRTPAAIPTLAERMAQAGYRTGALGHNYVLAPWRGLDRGFDTYRSG